MLSGGFPAHALALSCVSDLSLTIPGGEEFYGHQLAKLQEWNIDSIDGFESCMWLAGAEILRELANSFDNDVDNGE